MSEQPKSSKLATEAAEQILRAIYGDDMRGCTVSLEEIAGPIREALAKVGPDTRELCEVYEKVIEAIHLLSSPPENAKTLDPNALRSLLGERLDMIRTITQRTMDTIALVRTQRGATTES